MRHLARRRRREGDATSDRPTETDGESRIERSSPRSANTPRVSPDDDFDDAIARAHEIASEILSPEERTLEVLTPPWDRALAGVVIDAEKSLSAMLEVSAEDEVEA